MGIPPQFEVLYVLALGKPVEQVRIAAVGTDRDIKYWRDSEAIHHVPKRSLEEIIVAHFG